MVPYYVIVNYYFALLLLLLSYSNVHNVFAQPKLKVLHQWKQVDFTFSSTAARESALRNGKFKPENCFILDVDVWINPEGQDRILFNSGHINNNQNSAIKQPKRRIFVSLPRFKPGVPATLATVTSQRTENGNLLAPFPNWEAQKEGNCDGVTSVYRMKIDKCGILWILDTGKTENFGPEPKNLCQPKVLAFDLNNGDRQLPTLEIPNKVLGTDSLLVTIAVDNRDAFCSDTFLYIADVTSFKLIVYDVKNRDAWRVGSDYFYPFPMDGRFNINGISFNLMDGILALALGPLKNGDRMLYFHSLASRREGSVSTSIIRNASLFYEDPDSSWGKFAITEATRPSQSALEDMTDSGILLFSLLTETAVACWNSKKPFTPQNIHIVEQNNETLQFPSGMKIIGDTLWTMTTEFQNFYVGNVQPDDVKYRILAGSVGGLIRGSGCDPSPYPYPGFPYDDPHFPFGWANVDYMDLANQIPHQQWESLKTPRKNKAHKRPPSLPLKKLRPEPPPVFHPIARPPAKPPSTSTWWSYDCRFQDYGPFTSIHVLCYFLGPSYNHEWKPKIMSYVGHSFVWPADYNWFSINDAQKFPPTQKANTSLVYPWFLSMWALGAFDRTRLSGSNPTLKLVEQAETFREAVSWSLIDIQYPSPEEKAAAIQSKAFVPENNLPLGVHAFKERIFVSLPKWKEGVPMTLGVVGKNEGAHPPIKPYPNWEWHLATKCHGLTSVFRMDIDVCNRLWVMDSGVVDAENTVNQLCPPQIVIFNLDTDQLVWRYTIPPEQVPGSSLLSNIVVEVLNQDCVDAYAYLGDVFRYGVVVYSYKQNRSWRLTHSYFYPDPLASDYNLDNIQFQWVDGLFGMALSPPDDRGDTYLFFHPLSSYREFSVPTWVLRNESLGFAMNQYFLVEGQPRATSLAHSTGSGMSRDGILFYNLLTRSAVGCWNWRTEYRPENQEVLVQNNETLSFPNDLRVDLEPQQSVWVLSNRLHRFLYDRLNPKEINFRILTASVKAAVHGTVCENVNSIHP